MSLERWTELGDETLVDYKVFHVRKSRRRSPRNGAEVGFFLIRTLDWVNVVAITTADELLLVRQLRHGTDEITLEIPGGCLHAPAEDPAAAAARELREETGHEAGRLEPLGSMTPNPAIFGNRLHCYLATGCRPVGELEQDLGEDLEVVTMPLADVEAAVRDGAIHHSMVLAGLYLHRVRTAGSGGG